MGVHGLTTYVNTKSDVYFKDFCLQDCFLVIDGFSLAANLYNSSTKINSAFGGDYDKYAKLIEKYFEILKKCNVTPIVICDGGYERRKINTVKRRNTKRIYTLRRITPLSTDAQCFPLMMRHVFREKIRQLGVVILQSDFEADNEIAALSKKLNAPVLSNDSDFFIFDVQYIPLSSMPFDSCEKNGKGKFYIPCQIFFVDNLLKGLGGLSKTMLPLLATVLGNDYIKASQFNNFYCFLRMDKSKKTSPVGKRVKGVASWLKDENFDSALSKIMSFLKKKVRKAVRRNIRGVIKGYTYLNTPLESYLPNEIRSKYQLNNLDMSKLTDQFNELVCIDSDDDSCKNDDEDPCKTDDEDPCKTDDEDPCKTDGGDEDDNGISALQSVTTPYEDKSEDSEECESEVESISSEEVLCNSPSPKSKKFPDWYLDEFRRANICPSLNTLISLKHYFYVPQVEDFDYPHAGMISLPILQTIVKLLGLKVISYWSRRKDYYVGAKLEPIELPLGIKCYDFLRLNELTESERKIIVSETMSITNSALLDCFPADWQLYILSIVFWLKSIEPHTIKAYHINALVMTIVTVNVIATKIGTFWQKKTFQKRYGTKLKVLAKRTVLKSPLTIYDTITEAINAVNEDDCLLAMDILLPYFHIDEQLGRHSRNFSRSTVHLYAQLQSVFELAVTLNSLLLRPFRRSNLSMFYNGTFLYNFTINFKNRTNILSYLENLFSKVPSVYNLFKTIHEKMCNLTPAVPEQKCKIKKPKRRNKKVVNVNNTNEDIPSDDGGDDSFDDSNNKYSLLLKQNK